MSKWDRTTFEKGQTSREGMTEKILGALNNLASLISAAALGFVNNWHWKLYWVRFLNLLIPEICLNLLSHTAKFLFSCLEVAQ